MLSFISQKVSDLVISIGESLAPDSISEISCEAISTTSNPTSLAEFTCENFPDMSIDKDIYLKNLVDITASEFSERNITGENFFDAIVTGNNATLTNASDALNNTFSGIADIYGNCSGDFFGFNKLIDSFSKLFEPEVCQCIGEEMSDASFDPHTHGMVALGLLGGATALGVGAIIYSYLNHSSTPSANQETKSLLPHYQQSNSKSATKSQYEELFSPEEYTEWYKESYSAKA